LTVDCLGFVAFVMNLQKPYLAQQFALFCWVHMTLLVVVVSSHFIMNNILEVRLSRAPAYARRAPALGR
jgi:threonine/homoserine/homoserine lactone efflux protein